MLKWFLALIVLSACAPVVAQTKAPTDPQQNKSSNTKLDAFLGTRGSLVVRQIQSSGIIKGPEGDFSFIGVTAISAYQPGKEAVKAKGFECTIVRVRSSRNGDTNSSRLDADEADSLSMALKYLLDVAPKMQAEPLGMDEEREIFFTTRGDFRVGFRISAGKLKPSVSVGAVGPISIEFQSMESLASLKAAIDRGLAWLKSK